MPGSKNISILISDELIINKIYLIRNQKVMMDNDLAEMYGIETKVLKQAVKRNMSRFPRDFMFTLSKEEFQVLRSQIVTSKEGRGGTRYLPLAFTELGVAMPARLCHSGGLSSILNSEIAIQVNIQIIRIFSKMKEALLAHKDVLLKLRELENDVTKNKQDIALIFEALRKLFNPPEPERRMIGFKSNR